MIVKVSKSACLLFAFCVAKSLHKKREEIVALVQLGGLQAAKAIGQFLPSLTVMVDGVDISIYLQDENYGCYGPLDSVPEVRDSDRFQIFANFAAGNESKILS